MSPPLSGYQNKFQSTSLPYDLNQNRHSIQIDANTAVETNEFEPGPDLETLLVKLASILAENDFALHLHHSLVQHRRHLDLQVKQLRPGLVA